MLGRTALVTGANRGIGFEVCRQLASVGYEIILTARNRRAGSAAARRLRDDGHSVQFVELDLERFDSIESVSDRLARSNDTIDVMVNNAGVVFDTSDEGLVRRTLAVNYYGPLQLTEKLLTYLRPNSSVVMVSSGFGSLFTLAPHLRRRFVDPTIDRNGLRRLIDEFMEERRRGRHVEQGWPATESEYRVSKIALNSLVRLLAVELSARNIRVNAACPGWTRTRMTHFTGRRSVRVGARSVVSTALQERVTGGFFRDGQRIPW